MTFPASSLYAANLLAAWGATATNIDLDTNQLKVALYTDSMVQDPTAGTALGYSATGELANGNGYTTAGANLGGTVTWAVSGGLLVCSTSAVTSWTTATMSNVYGCVVYDSIATSPVANPAIVAVKFGTVGSSGGGTFTIDWADSPTTNTIFTIDPTP